MLTTENKQRIIQAILANRNNFEGSDAKYSVSLGINKSVYSRLIKGDTEKVLSEAKWISLARMLDVRLKSETEWQTARTPVFEYITRSLSICQQEGTSGLLCDKADIGKTYAALHYVKRSKNAVYVDCSQVKNKQKLVRFIAKGFGVDYTGRYADVYQDLVWYLKSIENPLIILDEAGDLDYSAFLELKALWNATEHFCGWYMMGADGLKAKIDRSITHKKVGFTEIYSRYGGRYQSVVPKETKEAEKFLMDQAAALILANYPNAHDIQTILTKTRGSLRRCRTEVSKARATN